MKRISLLVLALLLASFIGLSCSGDEKTSTTTPTARYGTVSGIVSSGGLAPLSGVTVSVGSITAQTNESGWFSLAQVPVGDVVVRISLAGYLSGFRNASVLRNQTTHLGAVSLILAETETIAASVGGMVAAADGDGAVDFGANTFVDAAGDAYTGDVDIELSVVVPTDDDFFESFPGAFEGVREDGSVVQFESFGFMGVNMFGDDRAEPLQLADGSTAELRIRVDETMRAAAPPTMPMWYWDEEDGVWREEGEATLVNDEYVTDVAHFTIWNWDYPIEDICTIEGDIVSNLGDPVADARVISEGQGVAYRDEAYTDASGHFSVRALRNTTAAVWGIKGSYASEAVLVVVGEECPVVIEEPLVLLEPAFSITLSWGLEPRDLDSHLFIPEGWNAEYDFYHLYFSYMGTLASDPFTALDVDDTSSYGPEIISGFMLYPGTYSYYVHNWCCGEPMGASPTTVNLEVAGQARSFSASNATGAEIAVWHVFDFTVSAAGAVSITTVNTFEGWDYSAFMVENGWEVQEDEERSNGPVRK